MYDIITFGSATLDVFVRPETFVVKKQKKFRTGRALCFPFPSKVDIEGLSYQTGGGGTNTAASFSFQGFKTLYVGALGDDFAGKKVKQELENLKIGTDFIINTPKAGTNLSVIFSEKRDRTCFVWRGASEHLRWGDINNKEVLKKAKWFYLAPLSGRLAEIFAPLVEFAEENGIKVFANPGNSQIRMNPDRFASILEKVEILLLNEEEASLLTGVSYKKKKKIFKELDKLVPGLVIMTRGKKGALASDGKALWRAPALETEVVEKTGAGDAFGSGFLSGFIDKEEVEYALQMGIANSAFCIGKQGAKNGLLKKEDKWKKVKIDKERLV